MIFQGYNVKLGYYKVNGSAIDDPTFATEGSACFDLRADLTRDRIKGFTGEDSPVELGVSGEGANRFLTIPAGAGNRWMIPSGLIFDIPMGFHLAVYMRGGTGLKRGIRLANGTGIIDADFVDETHLLLQNLSGQVMRIQHNERLCQAIVKKNIETSLYRIFEKPAKKTSRDGGYNSTGRA